MRTFFKAAMLSSVLSLFAASAFAETTISLRYNDADVDVIEAAIEVFEAQNPDINVDIERIAWGESRTQFLRETAVGTGPDVVHIAFVWPLELGSAGALLPLNDLIDKFGAGGAGFDDFIATDLAVGPNGDIYGLPWTADTATMVYNPAILAEAGLEVPKTWGELQDASRTILEKTGKAGFGFPAGSGGANSVWFLINYHMWSSGHALVSEDGNGGFKVGVDVPTLANTFTYLADFIGEGGNPKSYLAIENVGDIAAVSQIAEGDQAIGVFPPNILSQVIAAYQERTGNTDVPFQSAAIPSGSVGGISHLGGRMLGINSNTEHPEEAYKLIQFLQTTEFFNDFLTSQFPAKKSVLSEMEFRKGFEGYGVQLQNARSWGAYANGKTPIGSMWAETGREFGAVLVGDKTAEEAAESLIATIQSMLDS